MKTLQMIDDRGTNESVVSLRCECGYFEKANADRTARDRAERHMKDQHNGGLIVYGDYKMEV